MQPEKGFEKPLLWSTQRLLRYRDLSIPEEQVGSLEGV